MAPGATILVIGNEILSGKIQDGNSPFLLRELRDLGMPVRRVHVLPDEIPVIAAAVSEASEASEVVFTSGGVGPTLDDLTMDGVARAFGLDLAPHPELAEAIRRHFGERCTDSHLSMARLPEGAILDWNHELGWPVVEVRNVVILPGDPAILRKKFLAVRERFRREPFVLRRLFTTLDEGELAPLLDAVAAHHESVDLGSYPVYDDSDYAVQLTLESKDAAAVDAALASLREGIDPRHVVRILDA